MSAAAQPDNQLTEQEAAIYDRQLRVWGVETQRRLSCAKVLIVGCSGLAAEVAKNIVLAGVGSVTLVDDTPCSRRPPSNFLIFSDMADDTTVAEACVATLQEMNPFVSVAALPGAPTAVLAPEVLQEYDLLLLCGEPASSIAQADTLCREAGVAFYAGVCRSIFGWAFADLHQHHYVVEKVKEKPDGSTSKQVEEHSMSFATWQQATSCSLKGVNLRRFTRLYLLVRVVSRFEQQHGRFPTAADAEQLRVLQQQVCDDAGVDAAALPDEMLQAYAGQADDMPAINAIVGGVLGNELIKAVGGRNEPLNNFFLFSLAEGGEGFVEYMG